MKVDKVIEKFGLLFLVLTSIAAWIISYNNHLVTTYNDAMSHLDLSRLVIDDIQPGLSQLGGTWLPLPHLLALLFIWNNWMWHSGLAGSIANMAAYIVTTIAIYKTVQKLTNSFTASLIAAGVFATNLNILYLQTTPLLEPLYAGLFSVSVYFFVTWIIDKKSIFLALSSLFAALSIQVRYDGWFVSILQAGLVVFYVFLIKRRSFSEVIGKAIIFLLPVLFSMFLWLLWNYLIFGDPLYFYDGHYSAHAQQFAIEQRVGLITHKSWKYSFLAYGYATLDNAGKIISLLGVLGMFVFLAFNRYTVKFGDKLVILLLLLTTFVFNVLALYLGFSTLSIPELHWDPSHSLSGEWFNVRYGILVLPALAMCVGLFYHVFSRWKIVVGTLVVAAVFLQMPLLYRDGVITIIDGTIGSSQFANYDMGNALKRLVKPNQKVLLSMANFNAVAFTSGLNLSQFIHEGVSKEWSYALVHPEKYAQWIVMANGDIGEAAYTSLVKNGKNAFLANYKVAYVGKHSILYELKSPDEYMVSTKNNKLYLGDQPFSAVGVNDYDLAYQTDDQISQTFESLQKAGVTTIRFWMFGDGNSDGFQPQAGVINEARFKQADYILSEAKRYNMKVIPVLVNNWTDYGGKDQYLKWVGKNPTTDEAQFFTNNSVKALFENYIDHVLSRKNTYTGITYSNDPAILGWDIMNEPRSTDQDAMNNWLISIAQYIKQKDVNHLVFAGTEVSSLSGTNGEGKSSKLCASQYIDICSVHLYLFNGTQPLYTSEDQLDAFIDSQEEYAKSVNKPILLEEFGVSKTTKPFGSDPLTIMKQVIIDSNQDNYAGYLIWNWSHANDTSYGFSPTGDAQGNYSLSDLTNILQQ